MRNRVYTTNHHAPVHTCSLVSITGAVYDTLAGHMVRVGKMNKCLALSDFFLIIS